MDGRERERETEKEKERDRQSECVRACVCAFVCMYVTMCVCERNYQAGVEAIGVSLILNIFFLRVKCVCM